MTSIGVSQIASSLLREVEIIQRIGIKISAVMKIRMLYEAIRVTNSFDFLLLMKPIFCLL